MRDFWPENDSPGSLGVGEGKKYYFAPVEYSTASRPYVEQPPRAQAPNPKK